MARLLFEKTGNAVWISHLDLMRLFQRAFKRAGFPLKHTQGYNPKPSVSIALPLSVGVSSGCELLDFELECPMPAPEELVEKLNEALISGVKVLKVYESGRKIRDIALLDCQVRMIYESPVGEDQVQEIRELFSRESLPVEKKSKGTLVEQDIIPMIKALDVTAEGCAIIVRAVICCQNPSMNPMQIAAAVQRYASCVKPVHSVCHRVEIFDASKVIFR